MEEEGTLRGIREKVQTAGRYSRPPTQRRQRMTAGFRATAATAFYAIPITNCGTHDTRVRVMLAFTFQVVEMRGRIFSLPLQLVGQHGIFIFQQLSSMPDI